MVLRPGLNLNPDGHDAMLHAAILAPPTLPQEEFRGWAAEGGVGQPAGRGARAKSAGARFGEERRVFAALSAALHSARVVQEYVHIPIMTVPIVINNKLDFAYKKYNFNILVASGRYAGSFVRLSDESLINVAKGGGLIPALAAEHIPERFGN